MRSIRALLEALEPRVLLSGESGVAGLAWSFDEVGGPGSGVWRAVIEAEAFDQRFDGAGAATGQRWEAVDNFNGVSAGIEPGPVIWSGSGMVPGAAVAALPDADVRLNASGDFTANAPRLDYRLAVPTPGPYTVWLRGGGDNAGNSVHLGVDASPQEDADRVRWTNDTPGLHWTQRTMDGDAPVQIDFGESQAGSGTALLSLWMREDGVVVDRIVVTNEGLVPGSAAFDPQADAGAGWFGAGPAASERLQETGTISGVVFDDLNLDGLRDPGEPAVEGGLVWLEEALPDTNVLGQLDTVDTNANDRWDPGEGERWVRSDDNGRFAFDGLTTGGGADYSVNWQAPKGPGKTIPTTRGFVPATITVDVPLEQGASVDDLALGVFTRTLPVDYVEANETIGDNNLTSRNNSSPTSPLRLLARVFRGADVVIEAYQDPDGPRVTLLETVAPPQNDPTDNLIAPFLFTTNGNAPLADGTWQVVVRQQSDLFEPGFSNDSTPITYTIDTTPPVITVDAVQIEADPLLPPPAPTLTGTVDGFFDQVFVAVEGRTFFTGPAFGGWTLEPEAWGGVGLEPGVYDVTAFATDAAGNVGFDTTVGELEVVEAGGAIGGVLFEDINGNRLRDPGEPGLAGTRVWFETVADSGSLGNGVLDWTDADGDGVWDDGEGERWVAGQADDPSTPDVDETGRYAFDNLLPGTYRLNFEQRDGYQGTAPIPGGVQGEFTQVVTIMPGQQITELDAGWRRVLTFTPDPSNDSGFSPSDQLTNRNNANPQRTLTFTAGSLLPGDVASVYAMQVGSEAPPRRIAQANEVDGSAVLITDGVTGLSDGIWNFRLEVTDASGIVWSSSSTSYTLDTTAPPPPTVDPYQSSAEPTRFSGQIAGDVISLELRPQPQATSDPDFGDAFLLGGGGPTQPWAYFGWDGPLPAGAIDLDYRATDRAGNVTEGTIAEAIRIQPRPMLDLSLTRADGTALTPQPGEPDAFWIDEGDDGFVTLRLTVTPSSAFFNGGESASARVVIDAAGSTAEPGVDASGLLEVDATPDDDTVPTQAVVLTWNDGDDQPQSLAFRIQGDRLIEADETLRFALESIATAGVDYYELGIATQTLTLLNDDVETFSSTIEGGLWDDADGDGRFDDDESALLRGARVFLDSDGDNALDWSDADGDAAWDAGEGERWVTTDATTGRYVFEGLPAGSYTIGLTDPPETVRTSPWCTPLFDDGFEATSIDTQRWASRTGVTSLALSSYDNVEGERVANLRGRANLMSVPLDLSGSDSATLRYAWADASSETGDDMILEYRDDQGQWRVLKQHFGSGPSLPRFTWQQLVLPAEALHDNTAVRFRTLTSFTFDAWYLDAVAIATDNLSGVNRVVLGADDRINDVDFGLVPLVDFAPVTVTPTAGVTTNDPIGSVRFAFNEQVDSASLEPGDVLINGVPAAEVRVIDAFVAEWIPDATQLSEESFLMDGSYTAALTPGSVTDVRGRATAEFSTDFVVDRTAPTVVAAELSDGVVEIDLLAEPTDVADAPRTVFAATTRELTLTVRFSEPVWASDFGPEDGPAGTGLFVPLHPIFDDLSNNDWRPRVRAQTYDPVTHTATFVLPVAGDGSAVLLGEGAYDWRIAGGFPRDEARNWLNTEDLERPVPVARFEIERVGDETLGLFTNTAPLELGVTDQQVVGILGPGDPNAWEVDDVSIVPLDTDTFVVPELAGVPVAVRIEPISDGNFGSQDAVFTLSLDTNGQPGESYTAPDRGVPLVVNLPARDDVTGELRLTVSADRPAAYRLTTTRGLALETMDTQTPQPIDGARRDLPAVTLDADINSVNQGGSLWVVRGTLSSQDIDPVADAEAPGDAYTLDLATFAAQPVHVALVRDNGVDDNDTLEVLDAQGNVLATGQADLGFNVPTASADGPYTLRVGGAAVGDYTLSVRAAIVSTSSRPNATPVELTQGTTTLGFAAAPNPDAFPRLELSGGQRDSVAQYALDPATGQPGPALATSAQANLSEGYGNTVSDGVWLYQLDNFSGQDALTVLNRIDPITGLMVDTLTLETPPDGVRAYQQLAVAGDALVVQNLFDRFDVFDLSTGRWLRTLDVPGLGRFANAVVGVGSRGAAGTVFVASTDFVFDESIDRSIANILVTEYDLSDGSTRGVLNVSERLQDSRLIDARGTQGLAWRDGRLHVLIVANLPNGGGIGGFDGGDVAASWLTLDFDTGSLLSAAEVEVPDGFDAFDINDVIGDEPRAAFVAPAPGEPARPDLSDPTAPAPAQSYALTLAPGQTATLRLDALTDERDLTLGAVLADADGLTVATDMIADPADPNALSIRFTAPAAVPGSPESPGLLTYTLHVHALTGRGAFRLDTALSTPPPPVLAGDFDGDGVVDQSDLNLVLNHWGRNVETLGLPDRWVQNDPGTLIDQAELNAVLNHWGTRL
ncbi:MAG: LEPR-XLL domain-containing protein [Planctomycetota bacterium]